MKFGAAINLPDNTLCFDNVRGCDSDMFVEKVTALIGQVPAQFDPLIYVMCFILFLWLVDGFMWLARYLVCGR